MKVDTENLEIIYANVCQSLHIGLNNYGELREEEFVQVKESYKDVNKYKNFFE